MKLSFVEVFVVVAVVVSKINWKNVQGSALSQVKKKQFLLFTIPKQKHCKTHTEIYGLYFVGSYKTHGAALIFTLTLHCF